ncbi:MAG: hypothetical protein IPK99_14800 [Flavobacteriales bacterium]|nr:hypothetical protein [Flavobacteriales bacterium]
MLWDTVVVNLTGVEYLDSLTYLYVSLNGDPVTEIDMTCPSLPAALEELWISTGMGAKSVSLPTLKEPLEKVSVSSSFVDYPIDVEIAALEDTLALLSLVGFKTLNIGMNAAYVDVLHLLPVAEVPSDTITFYGTGWHCRYAAFITAYWGECKPRSGGMTCKQLNIGQGYPSMDSWPDSVIELAIMNPFVEHVAPWPLSVETLNLEVSVLCLPMLPNGLRSLSSMTTLCIPNIPDSIVDFQGPFVWGGDTTICSVLNTACPGSGAALAGRLYIDSDSNGLLDAGEAPMPMSHVRSNPTMPWCPQYHRLVGTGSIARHLHGDTGDQPSLCDQHGAVAAQRHLQCLGRGGLDQLLRVYTDPERERLAR